MREINARTDIHREAMRLIDDPDLKQEISRQLGRNLGQEIAKAFVNDTQSGVYNPNGGVDWRNVEWHELRLMVGTKKDYDATLALTRGFAHKQGFDEGMRAMREQVTQRIRKRSAKRQAKELKELFE